MEHQMIMTLRVALHIIKERQEGTVTDVLCKFADCGAPSGLGGRKYILATTLNAFVMGGVEVLAVQNLL